MIVTFRKSDRVIMSLSSELPDAAWYTSESELYDHAEVVGARVFGPSRLTEENEIELIPDFSPL